MSYEERQKHIQSLWDGITDMSDEEPEIRDVYSSDGYEPTDADAESDSDSSGVPTTSRKHLQKKRRTEDTVSATIERGKCFSKFYKEVMKM